MLENLISVVSKQARACWLDNLSLEVLKLFLTGFWVVNFCIVYAEFLVKTLLRWAPHGHLGYQGRIWGGSCYKVPVYAKFLKDLCTKKQRFEEHEVYRIEGPVSAMIQHNMSPKMMNSGSFTIGCQIGDLHLVLKITTHQFGAMTILLPLGTQSHHLVLMMTYLRRINLLKEV